MRTTSYLLSQAGRLALLLLLLNGGLCLIPNPVTAQSASRSATSGQVRIMNPGTTPWTQAVLEIPWSVVRQAYPAVDTTQLQIVQASTGEPVPYQFERRGQRTVQNLLVQLTVAPKQTILLTLRKGQPAPVAQKTYCRFVPERYDDFAWENDRIAFRIYGKSLNGRSDNAYGTDVWAKRTSQLVINDWYKSGDYHKDHGQGLDYYQVGLTLGAGDVGIWLGDSINYIHNYTSWQVLDNGPLRSTFRVRFSPYQFGPITVNAIKTFSLDAGSQLSRIEVQLAHTPSQPLPIVVGITLRPEPRQVRFDKSSGIMSYWEPAHGNDGTLGIGCVFPVPMATLRQQRNHALAGTALPSDKPFVYYSGAAWDKAGQITSADAWFAYLQSYANQLRQPLVISAETAGGSAPRKGR
ncbi:MULTISPECIES: DUF4861 family protein [Spirosoma]|uniref:DUF4861 domain-containing protein n=1 Tax=Spirosoma sordidisoli TaxID=2502893 RepID=A0A4Q2UL83_9BACT|nr:MULTISPECIES: DUF4861 family protein [Spirosoma]RYC69986.1 DUF4861 domain-containing protein [Spirosoma sordidisoli]